MFILPGVLSHELIINLPDEVIELLPNISSKIIIKYVNTFIANNINSSNEELKLAATKLQKAYKKRNDGINYLKSDELKEKLAFARSVSYLDVSAESGDQSLNELKDKIQNVLEVSDELNKMSFDDIDTVMNKINIIKSNATEEQQSYCEVLLRTLKQNKNLFTNSSASGKEWGIISSFNKTRDKLNGISNSIDTLLKRMATCKSSKEWRTI